MNLITITKRRPDGHWRCRTTVDGAVNGRSVIISTERSTLGGIKTIATCVKMVDGTAEFAPFSDFNSTIHESGCQVKCTEKNVRTFHNGVLTRSLSAIIDRAIDHYDRRRR